MALALKNSMGQTIAELDDDEDIVAEQEDSGTTKVTGKDSNGYTTTGYVETEELVSYTRETVTIPNQFAGLEAVMVPTRLQNQFFEIMEVTEEDEYVTVVATHVFYQMMQNQTWWKPDSDTTEYDVGSAIRHIMDTKMSPDDRFRVATDCTDTAYGWEFDYYNQNLVEAFLNPESGLCARFKLSLIRDNWDFYLLKNVGYDRGFVVERGKNMLGVTREESIEETYTRIAPYGRDTDGNIVWMNVNGRWWVDSQYINSYACPRCELLDTGIQITSDADAETLTAQNRESEIVTADNINAKLYNAAVKRFTEDEVDRPKITMKIDFVSLGDTEEYKQFRDLDKVYLFDELHIKNDERGYLYTAQVIGVEHDILTGSLLSVTIGSINTWDGVRKIATWQVPAVDGSKIKDGSIPAGAYGIGSVGGYALMEESVTASKLKGSTEINHYLGVDLIKSKTDEAGNILQQAGMVIDPVTGVLIYHTDNERNIGAKLSVQADKIAMVVGTNAGGNFIKAAEIATSINNAGEGVATINAAHVNISATNTFHSLAGDLEEDENGNLIIKSAGGVRVRRTESGIVSEFGVWDQGSLTGGVMVNQINGQTNTFIKGSKVWVGDAASNETLKKWATESDGLFAETIGAINADIEELNATKITASYITADRIRSLVDGGTFSSLTTTSLSVGGINYAPNAVCKSVTATTGSDGTITLTQNWMSGGSTQIVSFEPAASVTCLSPQKQAGSDDVSDDYKTVYCNVRSRASNGSVGAYTRISISAADSYNQGKIDGAASVTQRTVSSLSAITLAATDIGSAVSKTTAPTYSDGTRGTGVAISVNASAVYSQGKNVEWAGTSAVETSGGTASSDGKSITGITIKWQDADGRTKTGTSSGCWLGAAPEACYNKGWDDGVASFTYLGHRELGYMDHGNFESVGNHNWYYK